MTIADDLDDVDPEDVTLADAFLRYNVLVKGEYAGAIEGLPGQLEYIELDLHWEGKGVARAALNEFIQLSREQGLSKITTSNPTNPAMEHILKTEGFERQSDDVGWEKDI